MSFSGERSSTCHNLLFNSASLKSSYNPHENKGVEVGRGVLFCVAVGDTVIGGDAEAVAEGIIGVSDAGSVGSATGLGGDGLIDGVITATSELLTISSPALILGIGILCHPDGTSPR